MSSIDERIVRLKFDHQGFENGVSSALTKLKQLNESLKMKNSSEGISKLGGEIKNLSTNGLSGIASSVDNISSRLSVLGIIGTASLVNLANSAVNFGKSMAKSLIITPKKDGFSEYETKMNSIQTILTNTAHQGTKLKDVTKALDELNTYADKTIYNFAEMTKNIGTFTAAGVDLDTSTAAIKGIANLAAASGSSSVQASTAMYQLSQALAAGRVSLQDWNSVVNAGMGGKLFQDALVRTSEVMGTGAEAAIKKYGSFRESLTKGEWLTTDVLTETLKQISGAYSEADLIAQGYTKSQAKAITQLADNATKAATEVKTFSQLMDTMKESAGSGWAQTWEYIIGNKDQAAKLFTNLSDGFNKIIQPSTDARNAMFKFWNENGGRDSAIKGFTNIINGVTKGLGAISKGFRDVFPPMTGNKLVELTKGFEQLTSKFKMSDSTAKQIRETFKGIFSVFSLVGKAVGTIVKSFSPMITVFGSLGKVLLSFTSGIVKFVSSINQAAEKSNMFGKISNGIQSAFKGIDTFLHGISTAIGNVFNSLSKLNFQPLLNAFAQISSGLGTGVGKIFEGIGKAIGSLNFNAVFGVINTVLAGGVFKTIQTIAESLQGSVKSISSIPKNISAVLKDVRTTLKQLQDEIKAKIILKIAAALGVLAASLYVLSCIDPGKMTNALSGITILMAELTAAMAALIKIISKNNIAGFFKLSSISGMLIAFATSLLILSSAMSKIGDMKWDELAKGLVGVAGLMTMLIGASKLLGGAEKGIFKASASMIVFGAAIMVLTKSLEQLGKLKTLELEQGLLGVAGVMAEIVAFLNFAKFGDIGIKNSLGLIAMATALTIFSVAVKSFGTLKTDTITKGLTSIGALLGMLALFTNFSGSAAGILSISAALIAMGVGMTILSAAVKSFANMKWETIGKGLATFASSLLVLGVASKMLSGIKMVSVSVGISAMSVALTLLGNALNNLGSQSWSEIARSLTALAGSLVIVLGAMKLMSSGIAGASAMLVMSAALAVFIPQLIALSHLKFEQIMVGIFALAGSFTVLGGATMMLSGLTGPMIALSGALALLGVACLAAGAGVSLFAAGMATLSGVGAGGIFIFTEAIRNLLNLLPLFGTKLGEAFVNICNAIGNSLPQITSAVGNLITGFLTAITNNIPKIAEAGLKLLETFCQTIIDALPRLIELAVNIVLGLCEGLIKSIDKIADAAGQLVVGFLNGIEQHISPAIEAGMKVATKFIDGLADSIDNNHEKLNNAIRHLIESIGRALIDLLGELLSMLSDWGGKLIDAIATPIFDAGIKFAAGCGQLIVQGATVLAGGISKFISGGIALGKAIVDGLKQKATAFASSVKDTVQKGWSKIGEFKSKFLSAGAELCTKLKDGIKSKASTVSDAAKSAAKKAADAVKSVRSAFESAGSYIIQGLKSGIEKGAKWIADAASSVAKKAKAAAEAALGIKSPSRVFMEIGRYLDMGFAIGISKYGNIVSDATRNIANDAVNSVTSSINNIKDMAFGTLDANINPVITPVIDMDNFKQDIGTMNGMMENMNSINVDSVTTSGMINSIGTIQNGNNQYDILSALKDLKNNLGNTTNHNYQIQGVTYDDGSNVSQAVQTIIHAAKIERRI